MKVKPCPFCGSQIYIDDPEYLHRSGISWKDCDEAQRVYHSSMLYPDWNECYEINCPTIYGGCGATINADSKKEAIDKWNTRKETK